MTTKAVAVAGDKLPAYLKKDQYKGMEDAGLE